MGVDELELSVAWVRSVAGDTMPGSRATFDALIARYREPQRRYHTTAHVTWVVRHILHLSRLLDGHVNVDVELNSATAAAFYHDAIYDPTASVGHNERASAALAGDDLTSLGWTSIDVERVRGLIVATASHRPAADLTTAVFLAADLGVLAADPTDYEQYRRQIRSEYAHLDAAAWNTGRTAVIDRFLNSPSIYDERVVPLGWEARARANLAAERATLRSTSPH